MSSAQANPCAILTAVKEKHLADNPIIKHVYNYMDKMRKDEFKGRDLASQFYHITVENRSELPKTVVCMMDYEAAQILQGIHEQMVLLSQDPKIKLLVSFDRALQYAKTDAYYTNPQSIRKVLESLKKHGVSDGEIYVIAKVYPDNVDEVFSLVPSLKRSILSEPLNDVISQIAKLKKQT
ncbi:DNA-directed RNA polymerases IV and V subunit 4-like [Euphorbia lathyris]|uniref:DNA-directed RNA polymerases IV and V subunit 4-like n=1 Tax=Euphorbia lathyris TaxID=212925 RepID=UPI003313F74A